MRDVILYTTGCAKCRVLEAKLKLAQIDYTMCDDEQTIVELGHSEAPLLSVDGEIMQFVDAVKWVNGVIAVEHKH